MNKSNKQAHVKSYLIKFCSLKVTSESSDFNIVYVFRRIEFNKQPLARVMHYWSYTNNFFSNS